MQEKLIIFLNTYDSASPSWVIMDAHSTIKQSVLNGQPDELILASVDKEIIVLVPSVDVLLTTVALPNISRARLMQALPYALEEHLTSEVDKLHFAPAEDKVDGNLPVAIVSIDKMQEWLSLLQSWNIQADIFSPSVLALPVEANTWHVAMKNMAIVRMGPYAGFVCDKANLNQLLSIALSSTAKAPELIYLHHYSTQTDGGTVKVNVPIKEDINKPEKYFTDLAQHVINYPTLNLLQGDYRVKKSKFPQREKIWRAIACLAIAWVALLFIYPTISYFILSARLNSIENQIGQIYKRQFPESSSIVAPKSRMSDKLQRLTAQVGESKLLFLLAHVGQGMTPSLNLNRLEFQNNQLTLELTATSSEDIAKFTDYLTNQGLDVKQQNANLTGARVSATLVIG